MIKFYENAKQRDKEYTEWAKVDRLLECKDCENVYESKMPAKHCPECFSYEVRLVTDKNQGPSPVSVLNGHDLMALGLKGKEIAEAKQFLIDKADEFAAENIELTPMMAKKLIEGRGL